MKPVIAIPEAGIDVLNPLAILSITIANFICAAGIIRS